MQGKGKKCDKLIKLASNRVIKKYRAAMKSLKENFKRRKDTSKSFSNINNNFN